VVQVLVADDSDLLLGLVATWLEDEGYAVQTATTGQQALDVAAVHPPDVVLLDLIMPQLDGFEVCEKLKKMPNAPEIMLMTGVSDAQHLDRAADLCPAALLRKPFEAETLSATLADVIRRRRNARRSASNNH
jgi:DNA-binding response OmpR family regulator